MDTAKTLANAPTLSQRARNIRRNALRMGEVQGQGYIAQALDTADVLAVAYFHAMRFRPEEPSWEDRDRFLLSNGHYAIALYAALIEAGIVPEAELETYGFDESRLPMSGMASYTPGMEMSGGSLGLGLSIAVGMGLGLKRKGSSSRVYTLFSDGELDEGSKWEAMMSAAHHKLDNLIAIIDVNNQQADGPRFCSAKLRDASPCRSVATDGEFCAYHAAMADQLGRDSRERRPAEAAQRPSACAGCRGVGAACAPDAARSARRRPPCTGPHRRRRSRDDPPRPARGRDQHHPRDLGDL